MNAPLPAVDAESFARAVEPYRRELKAHCYRLSGSVHDAEDLLQDALVRAWKGLPQFEGRSSFRVWLYKVATHTCLNALESKKARGLPIEQRPAGLVTDPMVPEFEVPWLEPCPPDLYAAFEQGPEARYERRESVALAFLAALQLLPARQRALLVLHEVMGWSADECASLLEMSPDAVHSALQRARSSLAARRAAWAPTAPSTELLSMLERYLAAWEAADLASLVSLLHDDATLTMPPIPVWLQGAQAVEASMRAMIFGAASPGQFRVESTEANGVPALAVYQRVEGGPGYAPYALQLLQWREGQVAGIIAFLDPRLFLALGLPATLS